MRQLVVTLFTAALLGALASPALGQTSIATKRLGVGTNPTMPDGSTVRLQGLLTSGGTEFLVLDAEGDAIRRLLGTGDIPSVFTRRDLPESIGQTWQFGAGLTALASSSFTSATFSSTIGVAGLATLTGGYAAGTSSSIAGSLTLSGSGRRFLGDFSTATVADRVSVQSSTTNGATHLQALPNGTSPTSSFVAVNGATPTNAAFAQLLATSTEASLRADRFGGGSYLPLTFHAGGAERFRFATDGTGVVQPTTTLRTDTYASGTTGWAITGAGDADLRRLQVGELQAKSYIADLEQALNGGQIISKSNAFVAQAFSCPSPGGAGTLWVRDYPSAVDMRVFAVNDWVVLRIHARADSDADGNLEMSIADCVGVVTGYADQVNGLQTWTFTRAAAPNGGSASTGAVVPVETVALDFGSANTGLLETTVLDGAEGINSPYLQVFTWATSPIVSNRTVRTRLGKLTGLTGTANEFGLLAGAYAATDGRYLRASNSAFELHGVDLTIWDGATQAFLMRRNSGAPFFSIGNPAPTTFGSGVGFWAGDDGGTYKFRIGNPDGNRLAYDSGTGVLTIAGEGSGVTNIAGGNIQTGSIDATRLSVTAGSSNRVINSSFEDVGGVALSCGPYAFTGVTASGLTSAAGEFYEGTRGWFTTWSGTNADTKGVYCQNGTDSAGQVRGGVKNGWRTAQSYVVSFYARASGAHSAGMGLFWNNAPSTSVALLNPNVSTAWQRYAFRISWNAGGTVEPLGRFYISVAVGVSQPAGTIFLDAIKVEEGDVLGGYAPAPEEILPGTITADRLTVSSLSAISANLGTITAGTLTAVTINAPTIQSAGNWSLTDASGLLFTDSTSPGDHQRMVRWSGGSHVRGTGSALFMTTGTAFTGGFGAIQMNGAPSIGGEVTLTSASSGSVFSSASFQANSSGGSTLFVGNIIPWNGVSIVDGVHTIGLSSARLANINLNLPNNTTPAVVIVNKGGAGADANSALGYIVGYASGTAVTKVMGACSVTIAGGVITNVTGC
jgi:hypothetical protein